LPVYPVLASLDGVNFGHATLWEGRIPQGQPFRYHLNRRGKQFVCEATNLALESNSYDCVLSSNCLEHVANPLKALMEWVRVIRPGGHLLLVLPNKESNFDHLRPTTTFEHLREDLDRDVGEEDMTHLGEIERLHDLSLDPRAGSAEQFAARCRDNFRYRALHHHVFDQHLIEQMLRYVGVQLVESEASRTDFFALGVISK
jgi:ubiquinone/menaquinone biosynthesis C-methylase UbiE